MKWRKEAVLRCCDNNLKCRGYNVKSGYEQPYFFRPLKFTVDFHMNEEYCIFRNVEDPYLITWILVTDAIFLL